MFLLSLLFIYSQYLQRVSFGPFVACRLRLHRYLLKGCQFGRHFYYSFLLLNLPPFLPNRTMALRAIAALSVLLWTLNMVSSTSLSTVDEISTLPVECLYLTRQADHQVVVYRDVPNPKHPPKLKLESGTDITAFSTHYLPTGIAINGDTIYVASYGNSNLRRKVSFVFVCFVFSTKLIHGRLRETPFILHPLSPSPYPLSSRNTRCLWLTSSSPDVFLRI